ncbi:MAG: hypothetical protein RMX96_18065 [Nostoc sp. ChiSLP02]|nr:hypothetical protein [Nostoc sp. DedSLP05]MDZ8097606.1 hypothetical protein [Nostoc sp. DedSLP01]MDZ8186742.1 hypothetical protein [Nostoc sp. ChiSLP02]
MKFAVSIIKPSEYPHSEAFQEIGETIHYGLTELGYDSILTTATNLGDRQLIVLGANLLSWYPVTLPSDAIIYNLEQIYQGSQWLTPDLLNLFRQYRVWDYSQENILQLAKFQITNVSYLPIGYVPQLTRINQIAEAQQDIDVLFYGSLTQERLSIIRALQAHGLNTVALYGVYGEERDKFISRAKIVINIHACESKLFEIARVSYLLANQKFVISERGLNPAAEAPFSSGMVFADYDKLVNTCLDFIHRPCRRRQIATTGFEIMQQRSQANYLRSVLACKSCK